MGKTTAICFQKRCPALQMFPLQPPGMGVGRWSWPLGDLGVTPTLGVWGLGVLVFLLQHLRGMKSLPSFTRSALNPRRHTVPVWLPLQVGPGVRDAVSSGARGLPCWGPLQNATAFSWRAAAWEPARVRRPRAGSGGSGIQSQVTGPSGRLDRWGLLLPEAQHRACRDSCPPLWTTQAQGLGC